MKKILGLLLSVILALSCLSVPALADDTLVYIPDHIMDLELPDFPHTSGIQELEEDFDPFLTGMVGAKAYVVWDITTIQTACGFFKDLSYVQAVRAEYPEGNYIVAVTAFFANDAGKTLVGYEITYQTGEDEYYIISYAGPRNYQELIKRDKNGNPILDPSGNPKTYTAKKPEDAIIAGICRLGDLELRNGSGSYFGTAAWFLWDYDTGRVTMYDYALERLNNFPSPRVKWLSDLY